METALVHHAPFPERGIFRVLSPSQREQLARFVERVALPAGREVVHQGDTDRVLFIVTEGTLHIRRHGVEVATLEPGDCFGELGLVSGRARAATVVTADPVTLCRMDAPAYARLLAQEPVLANTLLQEWLASVGQRLLDMTDSVRVLLRERSLPRRATVDLRVDDCPCQVAMGTPLRELLPRFQGGFKVVAGLLGRKPVSLNTPVTSDAVVTALTTATQEGQRIYHQSLVLMMMEAAHVVAPRMQLRVGESLGRACRIIVEGEHEADLAVVAERVRAEMRQLVARDRLIRSELWAVDEALEHFGAAGWTDVVDLLRTWRQGTVPVVSCGSFLSMQSGPLLPSTGELGDFELMAAGGQLVLMDSAAEAERVQDQLAREAPSRQATERWLHALDIHHVGAFNRACIDGEVAQMIRVSEGAQEKRLGRIADDIVARRPRIVCVAGPSSSGKTTFIRRLKVQLQVEGLHPVGLSLDDYYVDRAATPRDEHGGLDYEAPEALSMRLLSEHLERLLRGETVNTAHYDFKDGTSHPEGGPKVTLRENDILMLEGIHGLNPDVVRAPRPDQVYRVFVCPRAQLAFDRLTRVHASDVRLVRRIVRDRHGRGTSAADNIARWPAVRAGERRHIFPYEQHADASFDSSLIYELSVLKVYAERYLLEVPQDHPSYGVAFRLLALLDRFVTIYPDHVPPTSFLREFIGGSGFEY